MFENWKEFKMLFNNDDSAAIVCESCGMEDFDLLCKEKDEDESLAAIFICKNCGIQKKVKYGDLK